MSDLSLETINSKIDTLLDRQSAIKVEVEKTNGRVSVLERFMHICIGGGLVFSVMNLPKLIELLGGK